MNIQIRLAKKADYESVKRIMSQVQDMHVEWRPDIYKHNENLIPQDVFEKILENNTFYVAESDSSVVGVLEIAYRHVESPSHVTRDVIFVDTMAIDENYRGIILKPKDNNVYLLLWIDKHDDAYKWAIRKRAVVNAQTGSIQVYDVEDKTTDKSKQNKTIENIEDNNDVAVISKVKLFEGIEDGVLLKIGIPEDTINVVREIFSIEDLINNKNLLPEDAYAALYFLAEGTSIDEIIDAFANNEVSNVDTSDFAGALDNLTTKQKYFAVDEENGQEELKEILDAPLEKWRVFLQLPR